MSEYVVFPLDCLPGISGVPRPRGHSWRTGLGGSHIGPWAPDERERLVPEPTKSGRAGSPGAVCWPGPRGLQEKD